MEVTPEALARFFDVVLPHMNEVQRRVVAGAASEMLGRGGKSAVLWTLPIFKGEVLEPFVQRTVKTLDAALASGVDARAIIQRRAWPPGSSTPAFAVRRGV